MEIVDRPGYRRLLRFDTVILNRGAVDAVIGNRAEYANKTVAAGTKQGFCFEDFFK